jgi:hypothetical protein
MNGKERYETGSFFLALLSKKKLTLIILIFQVSQINESYKIDFKLISCHTDGSIIMRDFVDEMRCDFFDGQHQILSTAC